MLYICIPAYNEAPTIGVLLWRIRATFQEHAREYTLVVYDDGSTDATAEVLEPYTKVLPLTILAGGSHRGYAAAVDALCRHVAAQTRYPRRDAMVLMQGDFTDRPEHLPELIKRFEGGADVVVTERQLDDNHPVPARRLARLAPWVLRPFVRLDGVSDLTSAYRLVRISLLRDLLRERGDAPVVRSSGWSANAELLLALAPFARRIESVSVEQRYDVRTRPTRLRAAADAVALARFAWGARAQARRANATPRTTAPASPRAIDLVDAPPIESSRPQPDAAPAPTAAPPRRKRSRREGGSAPAPASGPIAEAVTPSADQIADVAVERTRRRRRRRSERERPDGGTADDRDSSSPQLEVSTSDAADALDLAVTVDVAGDEAPAERRARRSRRGRKRRSALSGDGVPADAVPAEVIASDGASSDGAASDGPVSDAEGGDGSPSTERARSRRSRRGRRRGGRSAAADAGAADAGGAEAASPPAPEANAS